MQVHLQIIVSVTKNYVLNIFQYHLIFYPNNTLNIFLKLLLLPKDLFIIQYVRQMLILNIVW